MAAISPARAIIVATHAWTKLYTKIMNWISCIYECCSCHGHGGWLLPEATSTTVHICTACAIDGRSKYKSEVATHASTSVVFVPCHPRCTLALTWFLNEIDLCQISECANWYTYRTATLANALPLESHPFLPWITIIANNCWGIPPRFVKAVTIAARHSKGCYILSEFFRRHCTFQTFSRYFRP